MPAVADKRQSGAAYCSGSQKKVVALFGPTAHREVYLYDRGVVILPSGDYKCLPCLSPKCVNDVFCMDNISIERVFIAIEKLFKRGGENLKPIIIPESYNYIAVFLTFACNLRCSFCINDFDKRARDIKRRLLSGKEWVEGLNRIVSLPDLPITLQGGEPTLHKDFAYIVNNIKPELNIDVLTNLRDEKIFIGNIDPQPPQERCALRFYKSELSSGTNEFGCSFDKGA